MATVFMKWLETTPGDYDRGIQLLTWGRLQIIKERIASECLQPDEETGIRVLEIGCGTGSLAILMAQRGAHVTGIDASQRMLAEAERKVKAAGLEDAVELHQLDVTELTGRFEAESFDVVVSTLVFSELPPEVQRYALREAARLLKADGRLLIADEMLPEGRLARAVYWSVRLPLVLLTWLLTRTATAPLRDFNQTLRKAGFAHSLIESHLGGSLQLVSARLSTVPETTQRLWATCPRLRHRVTLKTLVLDFWSYTNRMLPPYAKHPTGLYRIGYPDRRSPVLVTGNYDLTVRRLVRAVDGRVDCWLVVSNSRGINVWCAAGGGYFTAGDVISAIRTSGVMEVVDHHALILPQLCANGVDGWRIRRETGWGVHWGPVRAGDIPLYLSTGRKKTDAMRHVLFPLKDRLEMTTAVLFFYAAILGVAGALFWRPYALTVLALTALISYVYGVFLPWLPGRDGLAKGITLAGLTLLGLWGWSYGWGQLPPLALFNWSLGLGLLAFLVGGEFQGMSPLMRGEQANWSLMSLAGLATLAVYGAGRLLFRG